MAEKVIHAMLILGCFGVAVILAKAALSVLGVEKNKKRKGVHRWKN